MKKLILLLIILLALVAVAVSTPLWGNCNQKQEYCDLVCNLKHYDSDAAAAGCKTRCTGDKASCMAEAGIDSLGDFVDGLKRD